MIKVGCSSGCSCVPLVFSDGLVRNFCPGAGTSFDIGGLEMVGFMFGSDSIVADGPEMFGFVWKSSCCPAGDGGDGLVMV